MSQLFKVLGNSNRLALLERLAKCCAPGTVWEREDSQVASVGDLSQEMALAPSTTSRYLKELVQAGFIRTERRGQKVACWVAPETLKELAAYFQKLVDLSPESQTGPHTEPAPGDQTIKQAVLDKYRRAAEGKKQPASCCSPACCSGGAASPQGLQDIASAIGYSQQDLDSAPPGANLGLGCGNPQAIAALRPGEVVVDLGSGGGFDCFLAARQVGPSGRVIGVDMTPEMIARARENAAKGGFTNLEFRLGEIEHLPLEDSTANVIISNCVINLAPDKQAVYAEMHRVLKPGGRLAIADVVATAPLPPALKENLDLWTSCAAGAVPVKELHEMLARTGFAQIEVAVEEASRNFIHEWAPGVELDKYVASARIQAIKPNSIS
ncbi:MAG: arsenite methyltransferase [Desulfarculaceae bacterium]